MNHRLAMKGRDGDKADDPMEAMVDGKFISYILFIYFIQIFVYLISSFVVGIYLIKVLEVIFDKDCEHTIGKKYNKKPTLVSHKVDNLNLALEFLSKLVTYKLNVEPKGKNKTLKKKHLEIMS
jgi:hypothetical protein